MDTWRTTPKLTLTYGLRYELFSPIMSRENNTSNFNPANGGGVITTAKDASGWGDRALINPDKNDFAPRLGFAYQMTTRLVWRGGYRSGERCAGEERRSPWSPAHLKKKNMQFQVCGSSCYYTQRTLSDD